jgi:hypothetical protein
VPELEAFKVLSLYRVKNSNSSGFEVSLFLNVAFKLHYKETSRERKVPDEYTDKSGTSGRDSDYSVIPSIRADGKTKQFRDGNTIWQFYPEFIHRFP